VAEVSIWLGGNLSGDPERRYTTGGTAQGRRCTVNGGNVRSRLAAGVAASGRGPAGRQP
jgi:single-stranded DNA-binding protein